MEAPYFQVPVSVLAMHGCRTNHSLKLKTTNIYSLTTSMDQAFGSVLAGSPTEFHETALKLLAATTVVWRLRDNLLSDSHDGWQSLISNWVLARDLSSFPHKQPEYFMTCQLNSPRASDLRKEGEWREKETATVQIWYIPQRPMCSRLVPILWHYWEVDRTF